MKHHKTILVVPWLLTSVVAIMFTTGKTAEAQTSRDQRAPYQSQYLPRGTGVYMNRYQITHAQKAAVERSTGGVLPRGSYWLLVDGTFGVMGDKRPVGNIFQRRYRRTQRHYQPPRRQYQPPTQRSGILGQQDLGVVVYPSNSGDWRDMVLTTSGR